MKLSQWKIIFVLWVLVAFCWVMLVGKAHAGSVNWGHVATGAAVGYVVGHSANQESKIKPVTEIPGPFVTCASENDLRCHFYSYPESGHWYVPNLKVETELSAEAYLSKERPGARLRSVLQVNWSTLAITYDEGAQK